MSLWRPFTVLRPPLIVLGTQASNIVNENYRDAAEPGAAPTMALGGGGPVAPSVQRSLSPAEASGLPLNSRAVHYVPSTIQRKRPDMTCLVCDLKLTPTGQVKLLETGLIFESGLSGYAAAYLGREQTGQDMLVGLWDYLAELDLPVCFLTNFPEESQDHKFATGRMPGRVFDLPREPDSGIDTLAALKAHLEQLRAARGHKGFNVKDPTTYTAIYMTAVSKRYAHYDQVNEAEMIEKFIAAQPDVLKLNGHKALLQLVNDKYLTNRLFDDDTASFRPAWQLVFKQYEVGLAEKIRHELQEKQDAPLEYVVVKPLNSYRGEGVLVVPVGELEQALERIFLDPTQKEQARSRIQKQEDRVPDPTIPEEFYLADATPAILVEAYEASKPVYVDGKPMDGTMRVMFTLYHDLEHRQIALKCHGAYWKLPQTALDDTSDLPSKLISKMSQGEARIDSARVSVEDTIRVMQQLEVFLPRIYEAMLTTDVDHWTTNLLFSEDPRENAQGVYRMSELLRRELKLSAANADRLLELAKRHDPVIDPVILHFLNCAFDSFKWQFQPDLQKKLELVRLEMSRAPVIF